MSYALVQSKTANGTAAAAAATLDSAPVQGNLMVVSINAPAAVPVPTGWTQQGSSPSTSGTTVCSMFWKVAGASESASLSIPLAAQGAYRVGFVEFSTDQTGGAWTHDKSFSSSGSGTSASTGTAATTTQTDEIWVSAIANASARTQSFQTNSVSPIAGASSNATTALYMYVRYVTAVGTPGHSVTLSASAAYAGIVYSFYYSGGGTTTYGNPTPTMKLQESTGNTGTASYQTVGTLTPAANKLYLAVITENPSTTPLTANPSLTGGGLTWTLVANIKMSNGNRDVSVFRAMSASPGAPAKLTFATQYPLNTGYVSVWEWDQVDTSGSNGGGAIGQVATANDGAVNSTTYTVTIPSALGYSGNAEFATFFNNQGDSLVKDATAGWTSLWAIGDGANLGHNVEWRTGQDLTVTATGISGKWGGIAIEIKASVTSSNTSVSDTDSGSGSEVGTVNVPISSVDSGVGSDVVLAQAMPSDTDAGIGADAIPAMAFALAETGVFSDTSTFTPKISALDSGTGTEVATPVFPATSTDTGAGSDAISSRTTVAADSGGAVSVETESIVASVLKFGTDAGTGSDASTLTAQISAAETAVGGDSQNVTVGVVSRSDNDAGTSADIISGRAIYVTDAGAGSDVPSISRVVTDSGVGSEIATPVYLISQADNGVSAEVASYNASYVLTDAGAGSDTAAPNTLFSSADAGAGSDAISGRSVVAPVDAGSGTDALGGRAVVLADTGTSTETISDRAAVLEDSGVGADAGFMTIAGMPVNDSDAGFGTDSISGRAVAVADGGIGSEATSDRAYAVDDTGAGTETASLRFQTSSTDTGFSTDLASIKAVVADSDIGTGIDTFSEAFGISSSDSGIGSETISETYIATSADNGFGSDTATAALAPISQTDSGVGTEVATPTAKYSSADTGSGADTFSETYIVSVSDSGIGSDGQTQTAPVASTDAGFGSEIATMTARPVPADSSVGTETSSIAVQISDADAGLGSDAMTAGVPLSSADSGSGVEFISSKVFGADDIGSGADFGTLGTPVVVTDTGSGNDFITDRKLVLTEAAVGADSFTETATYNGINRLLVTGNEITDAVRIADIQGDARGDSILNLLYKKAGSDPVAGGSNLQGGTKTSLGGGKWRITSGAAGETFRMFCNLADLVSSVAYTGQVKFANFTGGGNLTLDWCDTASGATGITTAQSGFLSTTGSRVYDNTYRFLDVTLPPNSSVDIWDAQVEIGSVANRYSGSASPQNVGDSSFGIWETATNYITNGSFETDSAGWAKYNLTGGNNPISLGTDGGIFGANYLKCVCDNIGNFGMKFVGLRTGAPLAQLPYTWSAWVRAGNPQTVGKTVTFQINENGGATGAAAVATRTVTLTASWQRLTNTGTIAQADRTSLDFFLYTAGTGIQAGTAVGDEVHIDGIQVEQGSIMTPYVDTKGAIATRPDGRIQIPGPSLLNFTQGWVAARVRVGRAVAAGSSGAGVFTLSDGTLNNMIVGFQNFGGTGWQIYERIAGAGAFSQALNGPVPTVDMLATVVFAWDAGVCKISVNGGAFATAARTHGFPTGTPYFEIGSLMPWLSNSRMDGDVFWLACGTGQLVQADAALINSWGNIDHDINEFPGNPVYCWSANTSDFQDPSLISERTTVVDTGVAPVQISSSDSGTGSEISSLTAQIGVTRLARFDFEQNITGWAAAGQGTITISRDTAVTRNGSLGSIKAVTDGTNNSQGFYATSLAGQNIPGGTQLNFSGWVRPAAGVAIYLFTRLGFPDATSYNPPSYPAVTGDGSTWYFLQQSLVVPLDKIGDMWYIGFRTVNNAVTTFNGEDFEITRSINVDSGTDSEAISGRAVVVADSGTGVETASVDAAVISSSDSGTGTDDTSSKRFSDSDIGIGSEIETLTAQIGVTRISKMDLETGIAGWAGASAGSTISWENSITHSGNGSIKAVTDGTIVAQGALTNGPIPGNGLPGDVFNFTLWVRPAAGAQVYLMARLQFTDATNLDTAYVAGGAGTVTGDGSTWYFMRASLMVPAGKVAQTWWLGARTPSGIAAQATTVYLDDGEVTRQVTSEIPVGVDDVPLRKISVADNGGGTQEAASLAAVQISSSDSGTGTESTGDRKIATAETGFFSDNSTLVARISATDTGTGTDVGTFNVSHMVADSGVGTQTSAISAKLNPVDTGTSTEDAYISAVSFYDEDTGHGDDVAITTRDIHTSDDNWIISVGSEEAPVLISTKQNVPELVSAGMNTPTLVSVGDAHKLHLTATGKRGPQLERVK